MQTKIDRKGQVIKKKRVSPEVEKVLRRVCGRKGLKVPRSLLWVNADSHFESEEEDNAFCREKAKFFLDR